MIPVLPRWVTQLAAVFLTLSVALEGIRQLVTVVGDQLPGEVVFGLAVGSGIFGILGHAFGDTDGDGIPNALDTDFTPPTPPAPTPGAPDR